jgi:multiple sugar transport system substrate-binding protein
MKRPLSRLGIVAVATTSTLLLSACMGGGGGDSAGDESEGDGGGTVRIASAETDAAAMEALNAAGADYEEETGTSVVFEAIPLNDIYTKVNAAAGTNAEYDALITGFIGHIALFESEDKLVPVDDIIESLGGAEDFYDGQILFPIEDQYWWVPFDYNIAFGYIRQDWLDEAGLEVPTTWEEMLTVAAAFNERSGSEYGLLMPLAADGATNWITSQVMWANEVRIFDDEWNVILDSEETLAKAVESLELLKQLHEYMPAGVENASYAETVEAFASGQVGMSFYSGRMLDTMIAQNPDAADDVVAFGFPMRNGEGTTASLGYDGFGVLQTEDSEATKGFIEWFFQERILDLYATAPYHYLPTQRSTFESEEWRSLPTLDLRWDEVMVPQEEFTGNPNLHSIDTDGPAVDERSGDVFQSLIFPKMFQRVVLNGEDPETVVRESADEIREIAGE